MTNFLIKAKTRQETGRANQKLREEGFIPAVVYGRGIEPKNIALEYLVFEKLYTEAGESNLIDLSIDGGDPNKVIVKDVRYDSVSDKIIHIDFKQINMNEKLHTYIPLEFVGEAPAVKEQGGVLVRGIDELEVECLPGNLVSEIEVDLASLVTFDDVIKIGDIAAPEGMTVLNSPELTVATVNPPRSARELEKLDEKPEEKAGEVEVEGEKKEEAAEDKKEEGAEEKDK